MRKTRSHHQEFDPDPLSIFLVLLGAVGSVASILAYSDQVRERGAQLEEASRQKAYDALTSAEMALAELRAGLESLQIMLATASTASDWRGARLRFGDLKLTLTPDGIRRWRQLVGASAASSSRLQRRVAAVLAHFAASEYKLPPTTAGMLLDLQGVLNEVIESMGSSEFGPAIDKLGKAVQVALASLEQARADLRTMYRM